MNTTIKWIAVLLAVTLLGIVPPKAGLCAGPGLYAKADQKPITYHEPKHKSEPEQNIATSVEEKKPPWTLIGVGVALAAVLALAGGGGGGGSNGQIDPASETGTVSVGW